MTYCHHVSQPTIGSCDRLLAIEQHSDAIVHV
jgi:hypothetical protein